MTETPPYTFTASVDLPDGRTVCVSIEVPMSVAGSMRDEVIAEHAEIAQLSAATAFRNMQRATEMAPF